VRNEEVIVRVDQIGDMGEKIFGLYYNIRLFMLLGVMEGFHTLSSLFVGLSPLK
jgi:hypothetical protein